MKSQRRARKNGPLQNSARAYPSWAGFGWSMWSLGIEASSVMALRMLRIARGGSAGAREARRMVSEKIESGMTLPDKLLSARTPRGAAASAISHYRPKVRANLRRLTKKK